jgi:uncharacterized membrane protein
MLIILISVLITIIVMLVLFWKFLDKMFGGWGWKGLLISLSFYLKELWTVDVFIADPGVEWRCLLKNLDLLGGINICVVKIKAIHKE